MQELNGFVKIFRKFRSWRWYKDLVVKSVFLECLLLANFKETGWMEENLSAGQFVTSYASLADNLGISVQQVRTAIKKLQKTGEISVRATNKYTVITVMKWADYQVYDSDSNKQTTSKEQTDNNQTTNNQQQRNNIKNNKNSNNSYALTRESANKKTKVINSGSIDFSTIDLLINAD